MLLPLDPYAYSSIAQLGGIKKSRRRVMQVMASTPAHGHEKGVGVSEEDRLRIEKERRNKNRRKKSRRRYYDERLFDTRSAGERRRLDRRYGLNEKKNTTFESMPRRGEGVLIDVRV